MKPINLPPLQFAAYRICKHLSRLSYAVLATVMLAGCASVADRKADVLDLSNESIVVMSMRFSNSLRPDELVDSIGFAVNALDRMEPKTHTLAGQQGAFDGGPAGRGIQVGVPPDGEALLVLRLPPGRFNLSDLGGRTKLGGVLAFSVQSPFEVRPRTVTYLGHLDLRNKAKTTEDDQSSGNAFLSVSFKGGTLDVKLKDRYEQDLARLHREYPGTRTIEVVRAPLPAVWLLRAVGSKAEPVKVFLN